MIHVQLDLETFGTTPGCAIRSIGAIVFDLDRPDPDAPTFSANIDAHSCLYAGLRIEEGTHKWWKQQSPEALAALETDKRPLLEVVDSFGKWCGKLGSSNDLRVWGQGANFDVVLWEAAAKAVGRGVPWRFYNCRDTRTLYDLAAFDPRTVERAGTYHCALDDAKHQVVCCQAAWALLKGGSK